VLRGFLVTCLTVGLAACLASADQVQTYGWEDGATICGQDGLIEAENVTAPEPVHEGLHSLMLTDAEPDGTPQAYIAWVAGLFDGDQVTASFWRYDTTPSGAPSCRIWGHYTATAGDINSHAGSASGSPDYGPGTGWDQASFTWTFDSADSTRNGLVIECRTYSNPGDIVWIDELEITAPDYARIQYGVCTPVIDLVLDDVQIVWTREDMLQVVGYHTANLAAAICFMQTEIQYQIDNQTPGRWAHIIKGLYDGSCWNTYPDCNGWCSGLYRWDPSSGHFVYETGECQEHGWDCMCGYSTDSALSEPIEYTGQQTCTVIIDPDNVIPEVHEDNNEMVVPIIPLTDAQPLSASWSTIKGLYR
jgi:hypothetical protein